MANALRRAAAPDLEFILDLQRAAQRDDKRSSADGLRAALARQGAWLIEGPGRADGLLVLRDGAGELIVDDLATHPEARGQGVGRRLLGHAEQMARAQGATVLTVEAEEQDPALVAWYEGLGFVRAGRIADFFHAGCAAIRLRKAL